VEDAWKGTELIVIPHRDQKDVYILGGVDDILVLLEESLININTILSSRNVGPIKNRVEEWLRQLQLFQKTMVNFASDIRPTSNSSTCSILSGRMDVLSAELAVFGEHLFGSRYSATAPCRGEDVHGSRQVLERYNAENCQGETMK